MVTTIGQDQGIVQEVDRVQLGYLDYIGAFTKVVSKHKNLIDIFKAAVHVGNTHTEYGPSIAIFDDHISDANRTRLFCDVTSLLGDAHTALVDTFNITNNLPKAIASYCDVGCDLIRTMGYYAAYIGKTATKNSVRLSIMADCTLGAISSLINVKLELNKFIELQRKIIVYQPNTALTDAREIPPLLQEQKDIALRNVLKNILFVVLNALGFVAAFFVRDLQGYYMTTKLVGSYAIKVLYADFLNEVSEMRHKKKLEVHHELTATHPTPPPPDGDGE